MPWTRLRRRWRTCMGHFAARVCAKVAPADVAIRHAAAGLFERLCSEEIAGDARWRAVLAVACAAYLLKIESQDYYGRFYVRDYLRPARDRRVRLYPRARTRRVYLPMDRRRIAHAVVTAEVALAWACDARGVLDGAAWDGAEVVRRLEATGAGPPPARPGWPREWDE